MTIQCELDKNPNSTLVMFFEVQSPSNVSTVCILVMTNSECRTYDDCVPFYNTFCRNSTLFSTQLNISKNWIGASVFCRTFNETSNSVVLLAEGRVMIRFKPFYFLNSNSITLRFHKCMSSTVTIMIYIVRYMPKWEAFL